MNGNEPDVSVIIGAYEAMPYLVRCLESVEAQTIGAERIEIVAVDDGSTDGTGEYLDEFAVRSEVAARVVRQANSGGPGGPRNLGLSLARGRYVFFLDADDYFGVEALERMVAVADRAGTDVVLGRTEGVNRGAGKSMYRKNAERTDVFSSSIKFTLSAQKLFRRELLVRHELRFDEGMRLGEDALFTMEAYLRADGVSVVADHTCYYLVGRDDGKHVTKGIDHAAIIDAAHRLMKLIAAHVPPGDRRDLLMVRPFVTSLLPQLGPIVLKQPDERGRDKLALVAPLMETYWTDGVAKRLKVGERLRLTCAATGRFDVLKEVLAFERAGTVPDVVEREGRRYLAYPHFGKGTEGFTDEVYEVRVAERAGEEHLTPLDPAAATGRRSRPSRVLRAMRRLRRGL
ncbi:glycosyltransferase family 2 protein [Streptomyces sp. ISL-1]|uniref:glycosyltransferase family 2 protein n=1 Tax=Streptomyces sp. ISL-1 TaxID=2817657 RepID=UPI001BE71CDE|nr:glycosyltransferase family 2 protein [Streptomyces sp. ISL-1]MBT2391611.1 glycosyltransferase family 2 protein [Streptomyces sp. ISL-1]